MKIISATIIFCWLNKLYNKKKGCENSMSLALPESRKRVEFWTKGTMHACRGIVFGGITGKGKERKLVGKRKSWYQGNGERLIKMTTLKKTRGLFLNFVGVHGAIS